MSSIRDFIPLQKIGEGSYSNVYKVKRITDQQIYALKKVKLNSLKQKQKQNSLNEVRILASLDCEFIVGYKQAFFDENVNVLCVVMQYANDGDLQKYIKHHIKNFKLIEEEEIWKAAEHILKGLDHLHNKGILHRDIKCANIFKSRETYKLGDLNVSKVNGDRMAHTQTGTPYYASPQVWRDEPYDLKSDIWSFGCIIYEMAALKPPFNGKDMEDLYKNVQKGKYQQLNTIYSQDLSNFVSLCLQKDPRKRPKTSQLLKIINKYENKISSLKIKNVDNKNNQLLKTIKLPKDLKKLNEALPNSKYKKVTDQNFVQKKLILQKSEIKQNKSCLVQPMVNDKKPFSKNQPRKQSRSPNVQNNSLVDGKQANTTNSSHHSLKREAIYINKSALHINSQKLLSPRKQGQFNYKSPKSKAQTNRLMKSPASEMKLGRKVEQGQSERLQNSERRPGTAKVERGDRPLDLQQCLRQITQKLKKPVSIPRTQKKSSLINNSHLVDGGYAQVGRVSLQPQNNCNGSNIMRVSNKIEALDNWRNKLVKKNRILSSNHNKPSWW